MSGPSPQLILLTFLLTMTGNTINYSALIVKRKANVTQAQAMSYNRGTHNLLQVRLV